LPNGKKQPTTASTWAQRRQKGRGGRRKCNYIHRYSSEHLNDSASDIYYDVIEAHATEYIEPERY